MKWPQKFRQKTFGVTSLFYKRKIVIAAICLELQGAHKSSIYNYYGTNRVIIVKFAIIVLIRLATPIFLDESEIGRRNIA